MRPAGRTPASARRSRASYGGSEDDHDMWRNVVDTLGGPEALQTPSRQRESTTLSSARRAGGDVVSSLARVEARLSRLEVGSDDAGRSRSRSPSDEVFGVSPPGRGRGRGRGRREWLDDDGGADSDDDGAAEAQRLYNLGVRLSEGTGVPRDEGEAARCWTIAAQQARARAPLLLRLVPCARAGLLMSPLCGFSRRRATWRR